LVGFEMTNFGENAKGYITKPTFLNPLWTSTSPTDFWGRKWNLMIHNILKGGVFLPARKFVSNRVAVLLSFVASGLLHDYVWAAIFYHHGHERDPDTSVCSKCFSPVHLKLTAFFLWNGIVMLLEKPLGKLAPFAWFAKLPLPLLSTLVVLTALPVSHWYTGDWVVGGYFADFTLALWRIKKL
jgi:Membrane bound O-acyl transferase family